MRRQGSAGSGGGPVRGLADFLTARPWMNSSGMKSPALLELSTRTAGSAVGSPAQYWRTQVIASGGVCTERSPYKRAARGMRHGQANRGRPNCGSSEPGQVGRGQGESERANRGSKTSYGPNGPQIERTEWAAYWSAGRRPTGPSAISRPTRNRLGVPVGDERGTHHRARRIHRKPARHPRLRGVVHAA